LPCSIRRIRRRSRRIEFFRGTLTSGSEIDDDARIFDTTLRDGEQSPGTSFSHTEKRRIAATLDAMGIDVIEAGFPAVSEAEFEAVSEIADSVDTEVCGLARVVEGDVEAALDAGVDTVHVFCSTSEVQLDDSMHATREEAVERSVAAVERVREAGVDVMFSPMDATRTDESFLIEVVEAVDEVGVDWVNVPDTCGVATPARFHSLVETVAAHTDARVDVHAHDDFGMGTANALAGFEAGADQAQVSVNGIGERAGNAALEEVVMALEGVYGVDTGIDTRRIADLSARVEQASEVTVPANKPVVGENAFSHESGIHAAGVIENTDTFEPGVVTPEMVGADRKLVLGKHAGRHAVRERLEESGFAPTDDQVTEVTRRVKERAESGRVTETDLVEIAEAVTVPRQTESREPEPQRVHDE
jgi:2-isopropylmalate synthase